MKKFTKYTILIALAVLMLFTASCVEKFSVGSDLLYDLYCGFRIYQGRDSKIFSVECLFLYVLRTSYQMGYRPRRLQRACKGKDEYWDFRTFVRLLSIHFGMEYGRKILLFRVL